MKSRHLPRTTALTLVLGTILAAGCSVGKEEGPIDLSLTESGAQLVPHWELVHRSLQVQSVAFSEDGREGWAVGNQGHVLRYQNREWILHAELSSKINFPDSVWISPNRDLWVTDGVQLHRLRDGQQDFWHIPLLPRISSPTFRTHRTTLIGSTEDGALVVRSDGAVALFQNEHFEIKEEGEDRIHLASIWMASDGMTGWGVDSQGTLLHFDGQKWKLAWSPRQRPSLKLQSLALSRDGQYGTAVGDGGILLEYRNGKWSENQEASALTNASLRGVWLSSRGDSGWAVGDNGTVLAREAGQWRVSPRASALGSSNLGDVWATSDNSHGLITDQTGSFAYLLRDRQWRIINDTMQLTTDPLTQVFCGRERSWAMSSLGSLFSYEKDKWKQETGPGIPNNGWLSSLWIEPDKRQGWAIGNDGQLFRLLNGTWSPDPSANSAALDKRLTTMAFSQNGETGWALGKEGTVLRLESSTWQAETKLAAINKENFFRLWLSPDGQTGWALSENGRVLRIENDQWSNEDGLSYTGSIATANASITDRPQAWAVSVTSSSEVFKFYNDKWERDPQASGLGGMSSYVWLNPDASSGWISGKHRFLYLQNGNWSVDQEPGALSPVMFRSLCLSPDQTSGWAVGDSGTILRFAPKNIGSTELRPMSGASIQALRGGWHLTFNNDIQGLPRLQLVDEQRGTTESLSKDEYSIETTNNLRKFILRLKRQGENLAERRRGNEYRLQIEAQIDHPSIPIIATFRSEPFYLAGRPTWQTWAVYLAKTLIAILALNIAAALIATRSRAIRTFILNPILSNVLLPGLGKYLVIGGLIRFVIPLKLAMFRDYRLRLANTQEIAIWKKGKKYVAPQISLNRPDAPHAMSLPTKNEEEIWSHVLRQLVPELRQRLWLIIGPSGLGKTALLENWTSLLLELGMTPLFLRLGQGNVREQAAAVFMANGDVDATPDVVFTLLTGGGFAILLDGFNEDCHPDDTREAVRLLAQRNLVIMTSQFAPSWRGVVDIHRIQLEPFGRPQLANLFGEAQTDEILARPALAEMARLPFTAHLLARYIDRHKELPGSELEAYADLWDGLTPSNLLNLEESAWHLFKANETELKPGVKLPPEFCDAAVDSGLLTIRTREGQRWYRFSHEKVHRLFVAFWIVRQEQKSLKEWHSEIQPGFERTYWTDVIDFWAQILARNAINDKKELTKYLVFMKGTAEFSSTIFAQRLYPLYDRLCVTDVLSSDTNFLHWAARFLASTLDPNREN